jgi:hypothetical protein
MKDMAKFTTENGKEIHFNQHDSWAIWEVPDADVESMTPEDRQKAFGESYKELSFPTDQLPKNMEETLANVTYVLVGLNPGNEGVENVAEASFLNFHGKKKSLDYRLAAALHGTELWGAFMTDLVHITESDSNKVNGTQKDVENLEQRLDALSIPKSATLVALGDKAYKALSAFAQRKVARLPHYSGANGHWGAEKTRGIVNDIVRNK